MKLEMNIEIDLELEEVSQYQALQRASQILQAVTQDDQMSQICNAIEGEINSRFTKLHEKISNQINVKEITLDYFEVINE